MLKNDKKCSVIIIKNAFWFWKLCSFIRKSIYIFFIFSHCKLPPKIWPAFLEFLFPETKNIGGSSIFWSIRNFLRVQFRLFFWTWAEKWRVPFMDIQEKFFLRKHKKSFFLRKCKVFLILELQSSISKNEKKFFFQGDFFLGVLFLGGGGRGIWLGRAQSSWKVYYWRSPDLHKHLS